MSARRCVRVPSHQQDAQSCTPVYLSPDILRAGERHRACSANPIVARGLSRSVCSVRRRHACAGHSSDAVRFRYKPADLQKMGVFFYLSLKRLFGSAAAKERLKYECEGSHVHVDMHSLLVIKLSQREGKLRSIRRRIFGKKIMPYLGADVSLPKRESLDRTFSETYEPEIMSQQPCSDHARPTAGVTRLG